MKILTKVKSVKTKDLHKGKRLQIVPVCMKRFVSFVAKVTNISKNHNQGNLLIQASQMRADEKVRAVATARMDSSILAITSHELVATEAHYHKSCYRDYTREYYNKTNEVEATEEGNRDQTYSESESKAYQMLFDRIRKNLFSNPRVVPDLGVEEVRSGTKKHIRRKLQAEFGESVMISPGDNGKLLVAPDCLYIATLVTQLINIKMELDSLKVSSYDLNHVVQKAGELIRKELQASQAHVNPLGPLPQLLGNCDGTLKKTSKASLARQLEKTVSFAEKIPKPSTYIIDGISLDQKVHGENKTFGELSEAVLVSALRAGPESRRIDVFFDVYRDLYIKNAERIKRGSESGLLFTNIVRGHKVKQWRRLLSSSKSKSNLIKFLACDWQTPQIQKVQRFLFTTYWTFMNNLNLYIYIINGGSKSYNPGVRVTNRRG